jgi:hypothetical protein
MHQDQKEYWTEMKVLVTGGRDFKDTKKLVEVLFLIHEVTPFTAIIEGGATGADRIARTFATFMDIPIETYDAEWDKYGNGAGPIRNKKMIEEGKPNLVVAFSGGKGTANMVKQAQAAGLRVMEIG